MFSKEESIKMKKDFWVLFDKRTKFHKQLNDNKKWILYDTRIKGFALKFDVDKKFASVMFEIDTTDNVRVALFNELLKYESLLSSQLESELIFEQNYLLSNGKIVSRIYTELQGISIHNKKDWGEIFDYFLNDMTILEELFLEIQEILIDVSKSF